MPDWYPRYPAKFEHGTLGFTLAERGAYSCLLDLMYLTCEPLPNDPAKLSAMLRCTVEEWLAVAPKVLRKFQVVSAENPAGTQQVTGSVLMHHVVSAQIAEQRRRADISRLNGEKGGRSKKRKLKGNDDKNLAGSQQPPRQGPASPPHTDIQTDINYPPLPPVNGGTNRYARGSRKNGANGYHSSGILIRNPEEEWRHRLSGFKKYGLWLDSYGPRPGDKNCEAPKSLVEEILECPPIAK